MPAVKAPASPGRRRPPSSPPEPSPPAPLAALLRKTRIAAAAGLGLAALIALPAAAAAATWDFPENSARRVAAFPHVAGAAWSLAGPDAGHFEVGAGVLRFARDGRGRFLPDHEDPRDADGDNDYELTVAATAPDGARTDHRVTVRVADIDEPGRIDLSADRPAEGVELRARLTDPDGPRDLAWRWQRSAGMDAFADIPGATGAAFTPSAGDTGRLLRAVAAYRDRHGQQRAGRTLPHAVLGPRLTGLSARAEGQPGSGLHPAFHPDVTHYAVACGERDVLGVSFSAPPGVRVDVDGVQPHPDGPTAAADRAAAAGPTAAAGRAAAAVTDTADVVVTAATADGASTRYTIHCAPPALARLATRTSGEAPGILFALTHSSWAAVVDAHGVPRLHRRVAGDRSAGFFLMPFGAGDGRRWAHVAPVEADAAPAAETAEAGGASHPPLRNSRVWVVRDGGFAPLGRFTSAPPLVTTGRHDFRLLGDGAALLMTYEPAVRDFSFLSAPPDPSAAGAPHRSTAVRFDDPEGKPWGDAVETQDSAIQIVEADGRARWTWSSWGRVPLEDCASHRFPGDYAHVNSVAMTPRGVLASFRGCSTVMVIDPEAPPGGEIVWRLGASNLRPRDWAARGLGPAPLALVGDPEGGFCGQHAAALIEEGVPEPRLLLFDNGVLCAIDPATRAPLARKGGDFSRAVEYALDLAQGEAVFVRDRSLGGRGDMLGGIGGHVARLTHGAWLVSWGRPIPGEDGEAPAPDEAVTLVDPRTGEERFALLRAGPLEDAREVRALPVSPAALAREPGPLAAVFPEAAPLPSGSSDEPGTVDIAVAFSRPVADFGPSTPSVAVAGGALIAVLPRFAFGKPAHGYLLRIAPSGEGALTLRLIPGRPCEDGGICAADGTRLTGLPAPLALSLDTNGTER